jgi:hypothetical protein
MNKLIAFVTIIALFLTCTAGYAADEWDKTAPAGSISPSDLDTTLQAVFEAVDRLLSNHRRDCTVEYSSSSTLSVNVGELVCSNAAGTTRKFRQNTSATSVGWGDIDTGSESSSQQYYVYAVADADANTFTISISTSSSAPSGATYYRKIGYFYNNADGDITCVGNIKGGDVANSIQVTGTDDISTSSGSYVDMDDMEVRFVSNGRPIQVSFYAPFYDNSGNPIVTIDIDGTDYHANTSNGSSGGIRTVVLDKKIDTLSAGSHTVKIQWQASGGTAQQRGSTDGARVLTVEEL